MIESLLCTLDIFTGLHFAAVSSRHFGIETETDSSNLLVEALDPLDGFDSFLEVKLWQLFLGQRYYHMFTLVKDYVEETP